MSEITLSPLLSEDISGHWLGLSLHVPGYANRTCSIWVCRCPNHSQAFMIRDSASVCTGLKLHHRGAWPRFVVELPLKVMQSSDQLVQAVSC